jgi:nuclear GTP-binding protein
VLKGVVRAERLQNPTDFVAPILSRVTKEHVQRHYGLKEWTDDVDFMTQLARQKGKLLKGGEPDLDTIAKSMIYDWQRVRRGVGVRVRMTHSDVAVSVARL